MNSKGFTKVELLIVIGIFSLIYFVGVINVTHAFQVDPKETEYLNIINIIEKQAEEYAKNNIELFTESNTAYIYVNDLINNNYIATDDNGNIINPKQPNKNLNDLKIKIIKDEEFYEVNIVTI